VNPGTAAAARSLAAVGFSVSRVRRAIKGYATVGRFGERGSHFDFDPDGDYSYSTIFIGDHVNLGARPTMLATRSRIVIGNHVLFGPQVTVRGGNHRFDLVGRYIDSVEDDEKRPSDDPGVVIEDDVWVGGNATILGGVTIGRGSIVAASAVVTKDVARYSVVAGSPARQVGRRFTDEEVKRHEAALGPGDEGGRATGPVPQPTTTERTD
jgi:acetyltransferase-like isoleucine patch superfamily enzyme